VDLRRARATDWGAGFFGATLVGLLWAPWYRVPETFAHFNRSVGAAAGWFALAGKIDVSAWQSMAVDDVIFCIAGLLGIWLLVATAIDSTQAVPIAAAVFASLMGLITAVLAVIRLIWPPELVPTLTHRAAGAWLGTGAAIGLTACALASMHSERRGAFDPNAIPITPAPPVGT
jgi:hypothetical protein